MARPKKNRIVAALIALVGGSFGIHKLYLREISGFVFYMFLMFMTIGTFPATAILGVFEAIRLLNMSNDQFDRKYNNVPSHSPYRKTRSTNRRQPVRQAAPVVDRSVRKRHNPYIKTGKQHYKDYELEEAVEHYEKALEIDANNQDVLLDLACIYSLLEQKDKSINMLHRLVATGFKDFEKLEKHDDLAFIRIEESFENFRANGYRPGAAPKVNAPKEPDLLQDDMLLSQLNKLMELRKKGLLSEGEFSMEKEKLMRR